MEATNNKACREALEFVKEMLYVDCNGEVHICAADVNKIIFRIRKALAAPPRQCDVGTAEEQNKRLCSDFFSVRQCGSFTRTALEWAQTPYESEANDGSK